MGQIMSSAILLPRARAVSCKFSCAASISSWPYGNVSDDTQEQQRVIAYGEKYKNITPRLGRMDLEDGRDGGMEVVRFGLRSVMNIDGVSTTRDYIGESAVERLIHTTQLTIEDRSTVKVLAKFLSIHCSTRDQ